VRHPGVAQRAIPAAILFGTGVWLLFAFAGVAVAVVVGSSGRRWWQKVTVGLAVIVLALPHRALFDRQQTTPPWEDVWQDVVELASAATRLLWIVAIICIVIFLRNSSEGNGSRLPHTVLWLGLLLSVFTVLRPTYRFLYVPVSAFVGAAILRYWLYQEPPAPVQDGRTTDPGVREDLLSAAVEVRRVEKQVDQVRQETKGAFDGGEVTSETRAVRVNAATRELAALKRAQQTEFGAPANELALNMGPRPSPWESGRLGALWAAGFSVPMVVLYIRRVAGNDYGDQFSLLWLAIPIIEQLVSWIAIGFLFGYFYTAIRGRSGLEKGMWVAVALIVPRACYTVLAVAANPEAWPAFGLWATEVAALSLLLGLVAGDLGTLNSVKWPWRRLRELQELGWLAGWASSLVVALGGVITSLLSGALASFIQQTLRLSGGPGP
jgi:Family of unknown function (DUF6185)